MITIKERQEQDKFKHNVWQAFSEIHATSETYSTVSTIIIDDCFIIVYNMQSGNGFVKRVWSQLDYSDTDLRERLQTALVKLRHQFKANGIDFQTTWTWQSEDNGYADFFLAPSQIDNDEECGRNLSLKSELELYATDNDAYEWCAAEAQYNHDGEIDCATEGYHCTPDCLTHSINECIDNGGKVVVQFFK